MFSRLASKVASGSARIGARSFSTASAQPFARNNKLATTLFAGATAATLYTLSQSQAKTEGAPVDYDKVAEDIRSLLDVENYDDGSLGPLFVRLAWHACGTYDKADGSGGSFGGATMRFSPEADHGGNAGLHIARNVLERLKRNHPGISYADLWNLAGKVSIEEMGGPTIDWTPGRVDKNGPEDCTPDGRLPDGALGAQHLRDIFYRMGFNDQEIVALSGAHTLGRCHTDRSGFEGPWTRSPITFSNLYFQELVNNKWTEKNWSGPRQFEDPTGDLMMLPTDMALIDDPSFKKWVQVYAEDEEKFTKDFKNAFEKLLHLGKPSSFGMSDALPYVAGGGILVGLGLVAAKSLSKSE